MNGGNWQDASKWLWDDNNLQGVNYPGDTATRTTDQVVFDNTSSTPCTLGVNLAAPLAQLDVDPQYLNQITLNGNVTVQNGNGFQLNAGTLWVNSTLSVGPAGMNSFNQWPGGTFAGTGTVSVSGVLYVGSAASSFGPNLNVASGGDVEANSNSNIALSGASNTITIQSGGLLRLKADNTAAQADAKGGITGGNNHAIWVYGSLIRGMDDYSAGGTVLIDVPVDVDGGTVTVRYADDNDSLQPDVLHLTSADQTFGYSLVTSGGGGTVTVEANATLQVANGAYFDSKNTTLEMFVSKDYDSYVVGNVTFGTDGGELWVTDEGPGNTGTAVITGNLNLDASTITWLNWNGNHADQISVSGTATLAGTEQFSGNPPPVNTWLTTVTAATVDGNFTTNRNVDNPNTVIQAQTIVGGLGILYQVQISGTNS